MSHKTEKVLELLKGIECKGHDPRYAGYFELFNRQKFYEAHDVLEDLWLPKRKADAGDFYKGLIQLAGAFVHLQKERLRPAAALFQLARTNLGKYGSEFEHVKLAVVLALIDSYQRVLEDSQFAQNPLKNGIPRLDLPAT